MEITQPMTVADAASALDQMMLPLDGEQQKTDKARLTEEDTSDVAVSVDEELDVHLLPQSSILCINGLPVPSYIGKLEAMDHHWQLLRRRMLQAGLPDPGNLPRKNVRRSDLSDLPQYFNTERQIELGANRYRDDLNIFYRTIDPGVLARGEQQTIHHPIEPP